MHACVRACVRACFLCSHMVYLLQPPYTTNSSGGMYEVYYLVQWEGFDESENTWESADSLLESG